jgi:hypothetical protein
MKPVHVINTDDHEVCSSMLMAAGTAEVEIEGPANG